MKVKVTKKGNIILKTQNEFEKAFVEALQAMLIQTEQVNEAFEALKKIAEEHNKGMTSVWQPFFIPRADGAEWAWKFPNTDGYCSKAAEV